VARLRAFAGTFLILRALFVPVLADTTQPPAPAEKPSPSRSQPLDEVTITARKYERRALENVIIPKFVQSHGSPSPGINQLGRWRDGVCPRVSGLQPAYNQFVVRRLAAVAQSVGAPAKPVGQPCRVNIEIVFTPQPQALLDRIAKVFPTLLGSSRTHGDTTFTRPVQSWYLTGTRALNGYNPPVVGLDASPPPTADNHADASVSLPLSYGVQVDPPYGNGTTATGLAGSRLGKGLASEFLHVFAIVDSRQVEQSSLMAVSDYLALVSLTRMSSLDTCSELPSIIDLLSSGCGTRARPTGITAADTAFLKSLYSSDLAHNINIERGDLHDRMVTTLLGH
jgi:hypothetical protein